MRDVFVRGVFGLCTRCAAELSVRRELVRPQKVGNAYDYHAHCSSCGAEVDITVSAETHMAGLAYMKQVTANRDVIDTIVEPVSPDEEILAGALKLLQDSDDTEIWDWMLNGQGGTTD